MWFSRTYGSTNLWYVTAAPRDKQRERKDKPKKGEMHRKNTERPRGTASTCVIATETVREEVEVDKETESVRKTENKVREKTRARRRTEVQTTAGQLGEVPCVSHLPITATKLVIPFF